LSEKRFSGTRPPGTTQVELEVTIMSKVLSRVLFGLVIVSAPLSMIGCGEGDKATTTTTTPAPAPAGDATTPPAAAPTDAAPAPTPTPAPAEAPK
jgi:hypothetical protein